MVIVKKFDHTLIFFEDPKKRKKKLSLQGYSFVNEFGHCLVIVYGESRRDEVKELLEGKIGVA